MRVEIFTLCEHAEKTGDDFSITRTFDRFISAQIPYNSKPCFAIARLRVEGIEADGENHVLLLRVSDPDGGVLCQTHPTPFRVGPPHGIRSLSLGFSFEIPSLCFREFGEYMIDIAVDRIQLAAIPLFVAQSV